MYYYVLLNILSTCLALTAITQENIQTAIDGYSYNLATYGDIGSWDVSKVNNMANLCKDKTDFNYNISSWNVSQVNVTVDMIRLQSCTDR